MNTLLVTTQVAGIVLLIATMVLLFFRRIYLDAETKQPINFKLPIIGEISTQAPVLVLVLVGVFMVVYPLHRMDRMRPDMATLQGDIDTGGKSVTLLVVAVPDHVYNQDGSGKFSIKIPLLATDATYRVKYIVDKSVIDDQDATPKHGFIDLKPVRWSPPVKDTLDGPIPIRKDVSDEELSKLSIAN